MDAFFITGSGTDVGKTFIISKIVNKAFKLNKKISVIKPIISGFNKKKISDTDTGILLKVLKKNVQIKILNLFHLGDLNYLFLLI